MDRPTQAPGLLELIPNPAFTVKDGVITTVNTAASGLLIFVNDPVSSILSDGAEEYAGSWDGCLAITVNIGGFRFPGTVTRTRECDLFVLDRSSDEPVPQALALSSMALRDPMGRVMGCLAGLKRSMDELELSSQQRSLILEITRSSYEVLRQLGNMSDMLPGTHEPYWGRIIDPDAELREICEKMQTLLENRNIRLTYRGLKEPVLLPLDRDRLERAVHNLVLNSVKAIYRDGSIEVALARMGSKLHLTVTDDGPGIPDAKMATLFTRYLRCPNLENGTEGLGLGLPFVRSLANDHGGTVLVERPSEGGARITVTLSIPRNKTPDLRCPRISYDYAGGFDHALVELAEVLPVEFYE